MPPKVSANIRFKLGPARQFCVRVAGIGLHRGKVLLHREEGGDFLSLPGGSVEFGENAADTLVREMKEELGADVRVLGLPWVVENFFEFDGCKCHELGLYFLYEFVGTSRKIYQKPSLVGEENMSGPKKVKLLFDWVAVRSLRGKLVYPEFLRQGLVKIPKNTQFVTQRP